MSILLLPWLSPAGLAGDIEPNCSFMDAHTQELRTCADGPSDASLQYLYEDEDGYRVTPGYEALFDVSVDLDVSEMYTAHDEAYDHYADDEDGNALLDLIRFLIDLLVGLGQYAEAIDAAGMTGTYGGTITNGTTTIPAILNLVHNGSDVRGGVFALNGDLVLDGGACPDFHVPAAGLPVVATSGTNNRLWASGHTEREVDLLLFFNGTVEVDFDMRLNDSDYRTLTGNVYINTPLWCDNHHLTFNMVRDLESLNLVPPTPPPTPPTCDPGENLCDSVCVDLDNHALNCGSCGSACGANEICDRGSCINITL